MSSSSVDVQRKSVIDELGRVGLVLKALSDREPAMLVEPPDQLAAENAVAAGVALLAGEELPSPNTQDPGRPILARDLLITVDLVMRALSR